MKIRELFLILILLLITATVGMATPKKLQDWIDLPVEVHDEIKRKLQNSQKYTAAQLDVISDCLKKSTLEKIINCLSDDGLEDTLEIGYMLKDEMLDLRDKICGNSSFGDKDRCKQLQKDLSGMGDRIRETWLDTLASGQEYLNKRTELTHLKKKICDKINKKDCWSWLNERLNIQCNPKKLENDGEKLRLCRMDVAGNVWKQLNANN